MFKGLCHSANCYHGIQETGQLTSTSIQCRSQQPFGHSATTRQPVPGESSTVALRQQAGDQPIARTPTQTTNGTDPRASQQARGLSPVFWPRTGRSLSDT